MEPEDGTAPSFLLYQSSVLLVNHTGKIARKKMPTITRKDRHACDSNWCGMSVTPRLLMIGNHECIYKHLYRIGASEGNRTLVSGLGSPRSAIEPHSHSKNKPKLEHRAGIEPAYSAWKADTRPICQRCKIGAGEGNRTLTWTLARF